MEKENSFLNSRSIRRTSRDEWFRFTVPVSHTPHFGHLQDGPGEEPEPLIESPDLKIISLKPRFKEFFLGYFLIEPGRELKPHQVPRVGLVFIEPLAGQVEIRLPSRPIPLRKGDSFFFDGHAEYRIFNPSPETNKILVATFPSFINPKEKT